MVGDLNLPGVDWKSYTSTNSDFQKLCDLRFDNGLSQVNFNRSTETSNNILDVVCHTNPMLCKNIATIVSPLCSDHLMLSFEIDCDVTKTAACPREVYAWKKVDFFKINYKLPLLNLDVIITDNESNVNTAWSRWKAVVL